MSTNVQNPVTYSITRIASETERSGEALKLLVQTRKWLFRQSRALSMFGKSDQSTLNRPDYAFQRLQPTHIESIVCMWIVVTYARRRLWLLMTLITWFNALVSKYNTSTHTRAALSMLVRPFMVISCKCSAKARIFHFFFFERTGLIFEVKPAFILWRASHKRERLNVGRSS